jgi:pantetheine-phosphate adenylyltransferase
MKEFKKVAVGGTFDQLHKGHIALICKAFEVGQTVIVGLTSDTFVDKLSKPHITASYVDRRSELEAFLWQSGLASRAQIVPLDDALGRTMSSRDLEALVVSKETQKTAEAINIKRTYAGMVPLKIVVVNMVPAENNTPISTTRIRRGEIDRDGHMLKTAKVP